MRLHSSYTLLTKSGNTQVRTGKDILAPFPYTLLYFYPKDSTPGCTLEGQDFTRLSADFWRLGIQVLGVSQDSIVSHEKFAKNCHILLDLLSDETGELHRDMQVFGEKNMYGKKIYGVLRSTFLLDQQGTIVREWRNVRATGHAQKILTFLQTFLLWK